MIGGRGRGACFGVGTLLMVLATVGAPAAPAAPVSLKWDPPAYDFGPVPYASGPSEPHEFTLTNTGGSQLVTHWRSSWLAYWPGASDPFGTSSPGGCHTLEPGESCSVELVFDPAHPGFWKGWQKVRGQVEEEPWAELELSGEGTGQWAPVTPEHLVFESVAAGTTTAPQTITLESQDREKLRIGGISFTPADGWPLSPSPFRVVGGSCHVGDSLPPGQTCTIEVAMAPTAPGRFQSKLEIADTAPGSPRSVELEGIATAAPVTVQPLSPPPTPTPPARSKRACAKGKRKVLKKGRRVCVKTRGHRHRSAAQLGSQPGGQPH